MMMMNVANGSCSCAITKELYMGIMMCVRIEYTTMARAKGEKRERD